eukprot:Clim_evm17s128 gene=Clim_evmTU17s128
MSEVTTTNTIFDDREEYTKHPLAHEWMLFYDKVTGKSKGGADAFQQGLKKVMPFDTVEDFWGMYNNVPAASELGHACNFHLFKTPILPMWEDPNNEGGGRWLAKLPKKSAQDLDDKWLNVMLFLIGEDHDFSDMINGAVVSRRKNEERIAVWCRDGKDTERQKKLGSAIKAVLQTEVPFEFEPFSGDSSLKIRLQMS